MPKDNCVTVYFFGRKYDVPSDLTVMQAMEYVGYKLVKGCGCRGGFCGACATTYKIDGKSGVKTCLACQKQVENGMIVSGFSPVRLNERKYDINKLNIDEQTIGKIYPEITDCVGCGVCSKSCPNGINVMKCVGYAVAGDYEKIADESFSCVSCGLCFSLCPVKIPQPQIFELARRIYGRYRSPESKNTEKRVEEIRDGNFDEELEELTRKSTAEMKILYENRIFEK